MWPLHQQITEPGEQESQQKALKEQLRDLPCLSPMGQGHPRGSPTGMGPGGQRWTPGNPTDHRHAKGLQAWAGHRLPPHPLLWLKGPLIHKS